MMWIFYFVMLMVLMFSYLLFAPFFLEINSNLGLFQLRFHKLTKGKLIYMNNSLILEFKILCWKKQIDLFNVKLDSSTAKVRKLETKSGKISFKKIFAVLRSFKIRKFYLNMDFGDVQVNGILFPIFQWLGYKTQRILKINFQDENEIILSIENNLASMIWAYYKY